MSTPRNDILLGQATDRLRELETASVDCIVTSPPYFRLRDYGVAGQIGLETAIDDWVTDLLLVLDDAGRVLTPTGTLWLNLGDSFSAHHREGAARKSLLLGPERLALALVRRGWLLRNKIVWAKTNTTPTSVRDRLATKHEVVYLLARTEHYYFDLDSIREPHTSRRSRPPQPAPAGTAATRPAWLGPNSDGDAGLRAMHLAGVVGHPLGKNPGDVWPLPVSTYRGAHFATYPERLVERMLSAGCPERRCRACRAPHVRPLKRQGPDARRLPLQPNCGCRAESEPGLVLDPFIGSGTTAVVAERMYRDWLGIELSPVFRRLALDRVAAARTHAQPRAA